MACIILKQKPPIQVQNLYKLRLSPIWNYLTKTKQKQVKLLLDDSIKSYRLNANEACIYACIAKCTRAGKGWYGNYAALADAMPFVIEKTTAYRAVQKLYQLGLIERRDDNHLYALQIATKPLQNAIEPLQNAMESLQNATESLQNAIPPITPLNNKNMNEIKEEKQQPRALHAHDGAKQQTAFDEFKELFIKVSPISQEGGENWFKYRGAACEQRWAKISEVKRKAIIKDLRKCVFDCAKPFKENPYYYLCDFPEPQPTFLSGTEQDKARANGEALVQVIYNGLYKICTLEVAKEHNLKINKPW